MKLLPKSLGIAVVLSCFILQVPLIAHHVSLLLSNAENPSHDIAIISKSHPVQGENESKEVEKTDIELIKESAISPNPKDKDPRVFEKILEPELTDDLSLNKSKTSPTQKLNAQSPISIDQGALIISTIFEFEEEQLPFQIHSIQAFYEYTGRLPIALDIYDGYSELMLYSDEYVTESTLDKPTELWLEKPILVDSTRIIVELYFENSKDVTFADETEEINETISLIEYLPNIELIFPKLNQTSVSQKAIQIVGERTI